MRAMIEYLDYISSVAVHILVFLLGMMLLKQVVTSCCTFITTASSMNFNFAIITIMLLLCSIRCYLHLNQRARGNTATILSHTRGTLL